MKGEEETATIEWEQSLSYPTSERRDSYALGSGFDKFVERAKIFQSRSVSGLILISLLLGAFAKLWFQSCIFS